MKTALLVLLAQGAFVPPEDLDYRKADIWSEGTRMTAEVYSLKSLAGKRLPTILMSHGWGGTAANLRPDAVVFARAGYLVAAFDYRGWGQSDGRLIRQDREVVEVREVVDPIDQTTDILNALHWVHGEPMCDTARIGLWGSSYSGGHVVYVAARDPRVKALVSQVPALDSRQLDRAAGYEESTRRARGEIGYPAPGARVVGNLRGAPIRSKMLYYAPVEDVERAAQCAMLFLLAEKEELFDNREHGIKAYERAKGPRKLVTIPQITHYGIYKEARAQAQRLAVEWYDQYLKR
jgi:hypothetical protein